MEMQVNSIAFIENQIRLCKGNIALLQELAWPEQDKMHLRDIYKLQLKRYQQRIYQKRKANLLGNQQTFQEFMNTIASS